MGFAFFINLSFAVIELVGGILTNSMAILSDALHDFGDAIAIGMSWYLEKKSAKQSDVGFTYGYRRLSVVSAFITGVILVVGSIWIIANAIPRIFNPQPVHAQGMLWLAFLGIAVNGLAFWRMSDAQSLNEKMLRWHFIEDVTGWVLVLVGALLMMFFDLPWVDPTLAVLLSAWVAWNVFKHLKSTLDVFLQASPRHLRDGQVDVWIGKRDLVQSVHHVHLWSLDGEMHILTAHVVIAPEINLQQVQNLKGEIKRGLKETFGILEATIEFEHAGEPCVDPNHDSKSV